MAILSDLRSACDAAKRQYELNRNTLAAAINRASDSSDMDDIIASAIDLGLNATLHRLKSKDPAIARAIKTLVASSEDLSAAISVREQHILERNPKHNRVFVDDGREFTIDIQKRLWTYLDDPNNPIPITPTKMTKQLFVIPGFAMTSEATLTPDDTPDKKRFHKR